MKSVGCAEGGRFVRKIRLTQTRNERAIPGLMLGTAEFVGACSQHFYPVTKGNRTRADINPAAAHRVGLTETQTWTDHFCRVPVEYPLLITSHDMKDTYVLRICLTPRRQSTRLLLVISRASAKIPLCKHEVNLIKI